MRFVDLAGPAEAARNYPVLSLSDVDDELGEVVDHDCYEICRLSHCCWPNGPLDKGIARMWENYRRN